MASMQASLVKAGGTKTTDTSAPVSFIASLTLPKTGRSLPPSSTLVPALRALTPPTMLVPASTMRVVCFGAHATGHALDDDLRESLFR